MADSGLLDQAGSILLYVAPGFAARMSYQARFPQPKSEDLYVVVVSVVANVPVVAVVQPFASALSIRPSPTVVGYVALLLGVGVVCGYLAARLRDCRTVRKALEWWVCVINRRRPSSNEHSRYCPSGRR